MQKVEGSNPFSRFQSKAPPWRGLFVSGRRLLRRCDLLPPVSLPFAAISGPDDKCRDGMSEFRL